MSRLVRSRFRRRRAGWFLWVALLLIAALAIGWRYLAVPDLADMAPYGVPRATRLAPQTVTMTLVNPGFAIGYSEWRGNPLWAAYRLVPVKVPERLPRPREFSRDERTWRGVTSADYRDSGYQRGHLAPNYAIAQVHGRAAQQATFLMSNITPQKPALNQKAWQRLEEAVIDHFAPRFGRVWVLAGPIFDDHVESLPGGVEIPDAFYKVLLVESGEGPRVLAFRIPQDVRGKEPMHRFLVSVDRIEAETGLDFFPALEDGVEAALEARVDATGWDLESVDDLPPRY